MISISTGGAKYGELKLFLVYILSVCLYLLIMQGITEVNDTSCLMIMQNSDMCTCGSLLVLRGAYYVH